MGKSKERTTRRRYGRSVPTGEVSQDPAKAIPNAPPNLGRPLIPQIVTFSGRNTAWTNIYKSPDEALNHSRSNARHMRNDPSIMECLEARQRGTALLNWHVDPEDKKDPRQKQLVEDVTGILEAIPQFTEYRRNLLEALWYGRYGNQNKWGYQFVRGARRMTLCGWRPIHGDKLLFRYDDGSGKYDDNDIGIRVGSTHGVGDIIAGDRVLEMTDWGMGYFLEAWERPLLCVHKHIIEDGAFEDPLSAGRIHGVGIRDRIYWCWFQKQETMAHLMEVIERTGTGFTIYYYPYGNPEGEQKMRDVAEQQTKNNVILIPRMSGDPAMDAYGIDRIEPSSVGIDALKSIIHEFFGHQIKRYILGQILSTESAATGLGSGVADLHQDTFYGIIAYDAVKLEETLTEQLVRPIVDYNFPWARNIRLRFKIDTEANESDRKLQAAKQAWDMGARLKASDIMDLIGFSVPTEDDEVLQSPSLMQQQRLWERDHQQPPGEGGAMGDDGGGGDFPPGSPEDSFGPLLGLLGQGPQQPEQQPQQYAKQRYERNGMPASPADLQQHRVGETKSINGKTYRLNQNHRWELAQGNDNETTDIDTSGLAQPEDEHKQRLGFVKKQLSKVHPHAAGIMRALQASPDFAKGAEYATQDVHPKQAAALYQFLQQNAGNDVGGNMIHDFGEGRLGYATPAGSIIVWPEANGTHQIAYTAKTGIVDRAMTGKETQPSTVEGSQPGLAETTDIPQDSGEMPGAAPIPGPQTPPAAPAAQVPSDSLDEDDKAFVAQGQQEKANRLANLPKQPTLSPAAQATLDKAGGNIGNTSRGLADKSRSAYEDAVQEWENAISSGADRKTVSSLRAKAHGLRSVWRERESQAKAEERTKPQRSPKVKAAIDKAAETLGIAKDDSNPLLDAAESGQGGGEVPGLSPEALERRRQTDSEQAKQHKLRDWENNVGLHLQEAGIDDTPEHREALQKEIDSGRISERGHLESVLRDAKRAHERGDMSAPVTPHLQQAISRRINRAEQERKTFDHAVRQKAQEWGIDESSLRQAVDDAWGEKLKHHEERESAKSYARKITGLTAADINRLENQGQDIDAVKGIDTAADQIASMFPGLGWEGLRGESSSELSQRLWELIREGNVEAPSKTSDEFWDEVGAFLDRGAGGGEEYSDEEIAQMREENEAIPFHRLGFVIRYRKWVQRYAGRRTPRVSPGQKSLFPNTAGSGHNAKWEESKHPRDHGKFAPKGQGKVASSPGQMLLNLSAEEVQQHKDEIAELRKELLGGEVTPKEAAAELQEIVKPQLSLNESSKEPWQMTRDEYVESRRQATKPIGFQARANRTIWRAHHRHLVQQAIRDGKISSHPDYPDETNAGESPKPATDLLGQPLKPEAKKPDFGSTAGKQEALFDKSGKPGQKNLFADKGVPDELVQKPRGKEYRPGDRLVIPVNHTTGEFEAELEEAGNGKLGIKRAGTNVGALGSITAIEKERLPQFLDDLHGRVSGSPTSSHDSVNAVLSGKAKFLGRGNDGLAFDTGDGNVVKVASDTPFHWNNGLKPPGEGSSAMRKAVEVNEKLRGQGVPGLLPQQLVEHDGRTYTVMPKVATDASLSQEHIDQLAHSVRGMHEHGYSIGDDIQVGIGADGKAYIYDTGALKPLGKGEKERQWDKEDDEGRMSRLAQKHGASFSSFNPHKRYDDLLEKALTAVESWKDKPAGMPPAVAKMHKAKLEEAWGALDDELKDFYSDGHVDTLAELDKRIGEPAPAADSKPEGEAEKPEPTKPADKPEHPPHDDKGFAPEVWQKVQEQLDAGESVSFTTQTHHFPINPQSRDSLRLHGNTIEIQRGKNWDAVTGSALNSLAASVGMRRPEMEIGEKELAEIEQAKQEAAREQEEGNRWKAFVAEHYDGNFGKAIDAVDASGMSHDEFMASKARSSAADSKPEGEAEKPAGGDDTAKKPDSERDTAIVNVPLAKRGDIDKQIDRHKAEQAKQQKAKASADAKERASDKQEARSLYEQHAASLAKSTAEKRGVSEKEALKTLDSMVKWEPKKAITMLKRHAEEKAASGGDAEAASSPAATSEPEDSFDTMPDDELTSRLSSLRKTAKPGSDEWKAGKAPEIIAELNKRAAAKRGAAKPASPPPAKPEPKPEPVVETPKPEPQPEPTPEPASEEVAVPAVPAEPEAPSMTSDEVDDLPDDEATSQSFPDETPREAAQRATTKAIDDDYAFARKSDVRNAGQDLLGSARHKINQWRSLAEAEADGSAEAMVTRANLLKNEPHNLVSHAQKNALTALAMHHALKAMPPEPGYGNARRRERLDAETKKADRAHYLEAYRTLKEKAEHYAETETDPKKALQNLAQDAVRLIRGFREKHGNHNNTANALVDTYNNIRDSGRMKTSVMGKMNEFVKAAMEKYGTSALSGDKEEGKKLLDTIAGHAQDIMEGKSLPQSFGKKGEVKERFNAADAYVKTATRKGGRDMSKYAKDPNAAVSHLVEDVKFRGIQWGNYVTDDERKHHAGRVVEAVTDLADVLGLKPEDVSLEGRLGLAIGARGRAGASAHYEPGSQVINITRASGVGTIAHEWGHAFDHMLNNYENSRDGGKYMSKEAHWGTHETYHPDDPSQGVHTVPEGVKPHGPWKIREKSDAAMRKAYTELHEAQSGYRDRLRSALRELVRTKKMSANKANDYWNSNEEIFARTFERYVQRELETNDRANTYLTGLAGDDVNSEKSLWPTDEEVAVMKPAFDKIFGEYRKRKFGSEEPQKYSKLRDKFLAALMKQFYEGQ